MERIKQHTKSFLDVLKQQAVYMAILAASFALVGSNLPKIYLQYVDKKHYVEFTRTIGFDKKVYHKCDQITAFTNFRSEIETNIVLASRLNRIEGSNVIPVYSPQESRPTFVNKTESTGIPYTIPFKLPCDKVDLTPGVYYYEGQIKYTVSGVEKVSPYVSGLITIVADDEPLIDN